MNKILFLILSIFVTTSLYSYTYYISDGLCNEYANFQVNKYSFSSYWQPRIVEITKNAVNYWNEAGSEHHLYYDGIGSTNTEVEYGNWCPGDPKACAWAIPSTIGCISQHLSSINIEEDYWNQDIKKSSKQLETTMAHEFGHLLGLYHTDLVPGYNSILMTGNSTNSTSHLTDDDKYGIRSIYGKDDQNLKISSTTSKYTYYPHTGVVSYTTGNSDFQTYSKPQLAFQPNLTKGYDYIMVWNKANTRQINYRFVVDYGTNNNDLAAANSGELGTRHYISNSETLTAPSIAISDNGESSVIVWRQEKYSETTQKKSDDIWYAKIPTDSHPANNVTGYVIDSTVYGDYDYTGTGSYKAKTMSQPKVVWVEKWQRFVVFYTKLGDNVWSINYIISKADGTFDSNPTVYMLEDPITNEPIRSNWNPMAINCNQNYNSTEKACLMIYNEINYVADSTPSSTPDYVAKTTFRILEPQLYYTFTYTPWGQLIIVENRSFQVKDIEQSGNWDRKGYGHYSLASRKYSSSYPNYTVNVLNRITKSAKEEVNNLKFELHKSVSTWYGNSMYDYTSSSSYESRTGYSVVYNPDKQIYKYLWIEE